MIYGNQSYNRLGNQQPTYSAPEKKNKPLHLVTIPNHAKLAAVLILPPDKSMLLLIGSNGEACLLESHTHLDTGAIIAASGPGKLKEIASYIDFTARRDWTSNPTPFDVTFVTLL
ncbi:hypothetical protein OS493_000434 [Desmophyllum pertusum]|uniref:Uncharacterized protein n=1 Tax=Desmophyllum pertusum TaxID=174260 RepID=A0A9X0DCI1_9CNID|nr:hypothetical protein OS493_000434 [Desmophyllum pertusum]